MRIAIVVGEVSGDKLAASLMQALQKRVANLSFEGVLGPELISLGGKALYSMERLSVMGLIEPLGRLPELYRLRQSLIKRWLKNPPDVFIGVDAPDFNLGLEAQLHQKGIKTVHYVSPSVWAWRQGRIHKIKKAVDLMLTLLPFEAEFYQKHQVPVVFVGHPFADEIPLEIESKEARLKLGLSLDKKMIALLPGSRDNELKYLAKDFLKTAQYCYEKNAEVIFVAPLIKEQHRIILEKLYQELNCSFDLTLLVNQTRLCLQAADVVLVTSGTATLEVMLHKKPMVVAYRMHSLTFALAKWLVKIPYISLPNLLKNQNLVPEYIQDAVKPEVMGDTLLKYLAQDHRELMDEFLSLHQSLRLNASLMAAQAIIQVCKPSLSS